MVTPNSDDNETPDWEQHIDALEEACCRAFIECDFDQLDRMWSDELLVNSPINRVHDKKCVLELLRAGPSGTRRCNVRPRPSPSMARSS